MAYDSGVDDWPAIVVDNGSGFIKYGMAGDDLPKSVFSGVVGRPLHHHWQAASEGRATYVGDDAQRRRATLSLHYPIEHGVVSDWDDMETIWRYLFLDEMRVDPGVHPVLMTEPPLNPLYNREKMAQVLFEKFHIPALYVAVPALLSLYASGRVTGFAVESGASNTHTLAVYEGYCIKSATSRTSLAGREITSFLTRLLNERGYSFATTGEREIVREIKERLCYVAADFEAESSSSASAVSETSFELPDGQRLTMGKESFTCLEAMFRPSLLDSNHELGIADIVHRGIQTCSHDIRARLYQEVVLTGGNTMHRGFGERMTRELKERIPGTDVKVIAPPERRSSVWIGGSILGSLSNYKGMWISKSTYEEYGPTAVRRFAVFDPES
ncbi:actin, cytoplasmic 1-like isoform X1 [Diadema setosum]|uniref:actin, cytoplasmic 1-like isoform X1 n=1 Tax=Diadema setosum TaxID=31175 RepID=UPI003B3B29D4